MAELSAPLVPHEDPLHQREAVGRILGSSAFQRSHRLSQLLEYIAGRTLDGDFEALKESAIGQHVFARPPAYNSAEDNIVRASVRQLRRKLDEYYAGEGSEDEIRVMIPKGSYALALQLNVAAANAAQPESVAPGSEPAPPARRRFPGGLPSALAGFLAAVLMCGLLWLWTREPAPHPATAALALLNPAPGQRLLVVVPDAGVQLYRRLTGQTVSLQDYIGRRFRQSPDPGSLPPELTRFAGSLFDEATTQSFVLDLIPRFAHIIPPQALSVRHPSTLSVEDFAKDNALLISGPNGNPWVQLFDHALNFQIVSRQGNQGSHIENLRPTGSESLEYRNFTDSSKTVVCFARIAYLPGLSPASHVMLAGGPHNASTEAAARFLASPDSLPALLRLFHAANAQQLPFFELLIESRALGNSPWSMTIAAHRIVAAKGR